MMTDQLTTRPDPAPSSRTRSVASLVAAAVLIVAVVVAVLLFGVQRPPRLADVARGEPPEPPAGIAWTEWQQQDCVWVLRPEGSATRLTCDRDGIDVRAWTDDGLVVTRWTGGNLVTVERLDPDDGAVLATWEVPERSLERGVDGEHDVEEGPGVLRSRWQDGTLTVTTREGAELWTVETFQDYRVERGTPAPDGSVIAAVDSLGRLLLLDGTGEHEPRRWATDVPPWGPLVWEGTPWPAGFPTGD
jgi:hypothetical protein